MTRKGRRKVEDSWTSGGKPRLDLTSCLYLLVTLAAVAAFWGAFFIALLFLTNNLTGV